MCGGNGVAAGVVAGGMVEPDSEDTTVEGVVVEEGWVWGTERFHLACFLREVTSLSWVVLSLDVSFAMVAVREATVARLEDAAVARLEMASTVCALNTCISAALAL